MSGMSARNRRVVQRMTGLAYDASSRTMREEDLLRDFGQLNSAVAAGVAQADNNDSLFRELAGAGST